MDRLGIATSLLSVSTPGVHLADEAAAARPGPRGERGRPARGRRPPRPLRSAGLAPAAGRRCRDRRDRALRRPPRRRRVRPAHQRRRDLPRRSGLGSRLRRSSTGAARRVLIHPTSPVCWEQTSFGRPRPMLEFLFDTTRAVVNLVLNGTVARHPDLRLIVPHAGATLPVVADRVAALRARAGCRPLGRRAPRPRRPPLRPRRDADPAPARRAARAHDARAPPLRQRLPVHSRLRRRRWPASGSTPPATRPAR